MILKTLQNEKGQAAVEYVLLLAVAVLLFLVLSGFMSRFGVTRKIMAPIKEDFRRAYQYGHREAKGFDEDGGPELHPRANGGNNFRIFINPRER